jgi:hypothetical protein
MVDKDRQAREALEKLFPKPFTDYQWSLIAAQGYEGALVSGARTVEEVAQDLKGLMEAAGRPSLASNAGAPDQQDGPPLTWEQMEKLVLGRILNTGETSGPRATPGSPGSGVRVRRLAEDRQRGRRRRRRRVLAVLVSCLAVLAIAVVAVLLSLGPRWGLWGHSPTTTMTTEPGQAEVVDRSVSGLSATTLSTLPPATIPALEVPDYTAELSGAGVVPAVDTGAAGTLELTLSDDGLTMDYVLDVQNLTGLTVARLRVGAEGVNGDEIVTLYSGPTKKGIFSGVAAAWSFGADDFVGLLKGKTMADFIVLVESGQVYVNVGTIKNRDGELRGQLAAP